MRGTCSGFLERRNLALQVGDTFLGGRPLGIVAWPGDQLAAQFQGSALQAVRYRMRKARDIRHLLRLGR
jgi:hypothetical protein